MSGQAGTDRQGRTDPRLDHDRVERTIRDIEVGLAADDPAFARRLRRPVRAERTSVTIVVALLVATVVLLAAGLATYSWLALVAGGVTFFGAFAVDDRHRRRLTLPRR